MEYRELVTTSHFIRVMSINNGDIVNNSESQLYCEICIIVQFNSFRYSKYVLGLQLHFFKVIYVELLLL